MEFSEVYIILLVACTVRRIQSWMRRWCTFRGSRPNKCIHRYYFITTPVAERDTIQRLNIRPRICIHWTCLQRRNPQTWPPMQVGLSKNLSSIFHLDAYWTSCTLYSKHPGEPALWRQYQGVYRCYEYKRGSMVCGLRRGRRTRQKLGTRCLPRLHLEKHLAADHGSFAVPRVDANVYSCPVFEGCAGGFCGGHARDPAGAQERAMQRW